jgi:serine acetyltransferase
MDQPKLERDVVIDDSVLLVAGAVIGDGCIIGVCSVVTRSIPPVRSRSETWRASSATGGTRKPRRRFEKRMSLLSGSGAV